MRKGDKGSDAARQKTEQWTKWFNSDHIPDIVEPDVVDTLYETKCWTPCRAQQAQGHSTPATGAAPSDNEGSHIAFGGTAESARRGGL